MTERPMRVLHVGKFYPPHHGGMESHLELLSRELLKRGVDVRVIVSSDDRRTVHETVDGVPVTRIGTLVNVASASLNPGLGREILGTPADVVHFHHPNPTAVLSYLASRHPGRLVVTYHSDIVRQKVLGNAFAPLLHRFLGRAETIIATSPDYAATSPILQRHAEKVRVIPFGVDAEHLARVQPGIVAEIRRRFGSKLVLGAGRLVYYKGFRYLVRAMARIDGRLLLAGGGPLRGDLEREAREAGVADRVEFLGSVPDLRPYLHAADVFVLPSVERSEAFGIAQLEAMACGVPVVNTALPTGVPFVSPHEMTGLTVPPADAGALAAAVSRILGDPALRHRLGAAARERATGELGLERMMERTIAVYHGSAR